MKLNAINILLYLFLLCLGCVPAVMLSGCISDGTLTPAVTSDAAKVESALGTVANVLQQFNTGLQTAAPTIDALLTVTHNQGDADYVNNVVATTAAATPALTTLLANVQTAIKTATTPAAQIAAVNAALSPASISAVVAPIAAAGSSGYCAPPKKDDASLASELRCHANIGLRPRYGWVVADNVY